MKKDTLVQMKHIGMVVLSCIGLVLWFMGCMGIRGPSKVHEGSTTQYSVKAAAGETIWSATGGEIDNTGKFVAPTVYADKIVTIRAVSGDIIQTKIVAVLNSERVPVSLRIEGPSEVLEGAVVQYRAFVTYDDGGEEDVTNEVEWSVEWADPTPTPTVDPDSN